MKACVRGDGEIRCEPDMPCLRVAFARSCLLRSSSSLRSLSCLRRRFPGAPSRCVLGFSFNLSLECEVRHTLGAWRGYDAALHLLPTRVGPLWG